MRICPSSSFDLSSRSMFSIDFSVRIHYNRENSGRMISPQRPCTAASYLSKSRPTSMSTRLGAKTNEERGDPLPNNDFPVKERRPIKVRIGPVDLNRSDSSQEISSFESIDQLV